MAIKLQSEKILFALMNSKPLTYYLPNYNTNKHFAPIKDVISKLDNYIAHSKPADYRDCGLNKH